MGKAIAYWLEFQILCDRKWFLNEKSLAQPVGEFISSMKKDEMPRIEYTHPDLSLRVKNGRPRQVDYALLAKKESQSIKSIIEVKWIGGGGRNPKQSILEDILRLNFVTSKTTECYFVVAGLISNFGLFQSKKVKSSEPGGKRKAFYANFLSFSQESPQFTVQILNCPSEMRPSYKAFYKEYKIELPKSLSTELLYASSDDLEVKVMIWRVLNSRGPGNHPFNPEEKWPNEVESEDFDPSND